MSLSNSQRSEIKILLEHKIRRKLADYSPETESMPFHVRLLGRDRMALFSFIQSINTTLGTSVFEQVAAIIARPHFKQAINQYKEFNNTISLEAQKTIQVIMDDLRVSRKKPDKKSETALILACAKSGTIKTVKRPRIDLFLETADGVEYYFDLKTAKPNMSDFISYKRSLLEWVAIRGAAVQSMSKIVTSIAIPYNPYYPEPYARWTMEGMFDTSNELMVADEFWNFLGGENTYEELLNEFENVGMALRPEIDAKFKIISPKS